MSSKSRAGSDRIELHTREMSGLTEALQIVTALGTGTPSCDPATRRCSVAAPSGVQLLPTVVRALDDAGIVVEDIRLRRPTLDEVFLALTGHSTDTSADERHIRGEHRMTRASTHQHVAVTPGSRGETGPVVCVGASFLVASYEIAARTVKKFVRSPQLIVAGTAQGALFLLIFRYVFGGSISHTGSLTYADYFIPGFVVTSVLFSGMGAATGIAEDPPRRPVRSAQEPPHPSRIDSVGSGGGGHVPPRLGPGRDHLLRRPGGI